MPAQSEGPLSSLRLRPNSAFVAGAPMSFGFRAADFEAVRPEVAPRSSHTAPPFTVVPRFSPGAPAVRSAFPSPVTSSTRSDPPKTSPVSVMPGTPAVSWWNACAPVPVRPLLPPLSSTTAPAFAFEPIASPGTPTARSG